MARLYYAFEQQEIDELWSCLRLFMMEERMKKGVEGDVENFPFFEQKMLCISFIGPLFRLV